MRPSLRQFLCISIPAAMLSVAAGTALGADDRARVIAKLSLKDLTPGLTRRIADAAPLVKITIQPGESLRTLVQKHCGRHDANFLALLKERSATLGLKPKEVTEDQTFAKEQTLEIPFCLQLPEQTYRAQARAFLRRANPAVAQYLGVPDAPPRVVASGRPFPSSSGLESYSDVGNTIAFKNPAFDKWPYAISIDQPEYVALPVRSGLTSELVLASLNAEMAAFRLEQRGIRHVTVLSLDEDRCPEPPKDRLPPYRLPEKYPVDTYAILRVLGLNALVSPRRGTGAMPIKIGDSGLYFEPLAETFASESVQIHAEMPPYKAYRRSQHGTYVASSALGGPYFMRFWSRLDQPVIIQPRNIISKNCRPVAASAGSTPGLQDYCDVDDRGLMQLLSSGSRGGIVNLSIAHPGELVAVTSELQRARDRYLIVVAAGNNGTEIDRESYPASLARSETFAKFVLVVGALEDNGTRLSANSSYHADLVEIAAPGCRVPVYEHSGGGYKIVHQSGTSIAAGVVSFAAALVSQQMDIPPPLLKRRLLISSDYEPGLEERAGHPRTKRVKNNARLNIPRALALFHDVVDLQDGRRIYGKLKEGENFVLALCGGQKAMRRSELRSLSIFAEDRRKKIFFYYGDHNDQHRPDARLFADSCRLSQANPDNPGVDLASYAFTMEDAETGRQVKFTLGDVANITLAHKPYWEH